MPGSHKYSLIFILLFLIASKCLGYYKCDIQNHNITIMLFLRAAWSNMALVTVLKPDIVIVGPSRRRGLIITMDNNLKSIPSHKGITEQRFSDVIILGILTNSTILYQILI